jgi:hypothetical protein
MFLHFPNTMGNAKHYFCSKPEVGRHDFNPFHAMHKIISLRNKDGCPAKCQQSQLHIHRFSTREITLLQYIMILEIKTSMDGIRANHKQHLHVTH